MGQISLVEKLLEGHQYLFCEHLCLLQISIEEIHVEMSSSKIRRRVEQESGVQTGILNKLKRWRIGKGVNMHNNILEFMEFINRIGLVDVPLSKRSSHGSELMIFLLANQTGVFFRMVWLLIGRWSLKLWGAGFYQIIVQFGLEIGTLIRV